MTQNAAVDIRSMQLLTDSINRTIDALNQVRLSVYGAITPDTLGVNPAIGSLVHTAAQNPYVVGQWGQWANQFANPYMNVFAPNQLTNPYAQLATAGLGPAGWGSEYADPYAAARVAQTFPFLHWGYSPFAWQTI